MSAAPQLSRPTRSPCRYIGITGKFGPDFDHLTLLVQLEERWLADEGKSGQPHRLADFAGMCRYHQTSPESHFTQNRICSRATPEGRVTLSDMRLIITTSGQRLEMMLKDQEEYARALWEHFGIDLTKSN